MPTNRITNTDTGLSTAIVTWTKPTANDNAGSVTLTSNRNPGSAFEIGETIVRYTAVDEASNKAQRSFLVQVKGMIR